MQNEALHIEIMLNKSQDCELKLFPIFFNVIFYYAPFTLQVKPV